MDSIWITVLLSLVGIIIGAIISFYFFRSQQKDNILALSENILKLNSREFSSERVEKYLIDQNKEINTILYHMVELKTSMDFSDKIDNHDKLNEVKQILDTIKDSFGEDLFELKTSIDSNFSTLISRFDNGNFESIKSLHMQLEKEFQKDVKLFIPSDLESEVLASKLVDNFLKLYTEINQIQKENLQSEREHFIENIDKRIVDSFKEFESKFENTFNNIENTLSLPNSEK